MTAIIVDPSKLFCDGMRQMLIRERFDVVETAAAIEDMQCTLPPDCVPLVIVCHLEGGVTQLVTRVIGHHARARVVVLADHFVSQDAEHAIAAGASGYLHKSLSSESFIKALHLIASEDAVVATRVPAAGPSDGDRRPRIDAALVPPARADAGQSDRTCSAGTSRSEYAPQAPRSLSPREQSILTLICDGESNKQIARQLNISEATVKVHIKTILRKIDVRNRTQAAIWAIHDPVIHGLLERRVPTLPVTREPPLKRSAANGYHGGVPLSA